MTKSNVFNARFTVVTVNFNSATLLSQCINSVKKQSFRYFEMVIVNNSPKESLDEIYLPDKRFKIVTPYENIGFAAACNLGVQISKSPYVVMLNPDAFPKEDWLFKLNEATIKFPHVAMFGSTLLNANNPQLIDNAGDNVLFPCIPWQGGSGHNLGHLPKTGECFAPCGAAATYDRQVFISAGGFDEDFFCYYEDIDLGFRLRLVGEKCIQLSEAVVLHVGSAVTQQIPTFKRRYSVRNLIWTFIKNIPGCLVPIFAPFFVFFLTLWFVWSVFRGNGSIFLVGLRDAISHVGYFLKKRKSIQKSRSVGIVIVLKMFCWSPMKLLRRSHAVKQT